MRDLHVHVGSRVRVSITAIQGPTRSFRVVGTTIAPWIDDQNSSFTGGGAVFTHAGLGRLIPAGITNVPPPSDAFVNFADGKVTAARVAQLQHQVGEQFQVLTAQPPTDLLNFGRVRDLPLALALLLVGLAAVTLFLTLLSSANRRRSDMALLKALGYRSAQLQGVVAWQSTAMTLVGLVIGLPLGIALGRSLWTAVANHLGLLGQPVVPAWQIVVVAIGAFVVANVAGAWPGFVAARTPVARVLRAA
jgi:ABC-type antimicrobial peptide transport system permease subunit